MMTPLIIVNRCRDWPLAIEGAEVIEARTYLSDPKYAESPGLRIYNVCRSYRYQSVGYYVSLLAEARGHKPMPSITTTVQDMKSLGIVQVLSGELDDIIQQSLAPIRSEGFVLSIYFGHNLARRHSTLARRLFGLFYTPFLQASFSRSSRSKRWHVRSISPIALHEIPENHIAFMHDAAQAFFAKKRRSPRRRTAPRYEMAILVNPQEKEAPSNAGAIERFIHAAEKLGISAETIGREDYGTLGEYDALFIRETTSVNHYTYRFARRAAALGLSVIDDPLSIVKCTNKVFLAEVLTAHGISTPRTMSLYRDNADTAPHLLGLPLIVKQPDSSFSQGVFMAHDVQEYQSLCARLFDHSDLIIAQEFMPTGFDWRVTVFGGQVLFVCKYFMAEDHWQIIRRDAGGAKLDDGLFETLRVEDAPPAVVRLALRAAHLIGDGLYGVDIKQAGKRVHVIEINDNPNLDYGVEDAVSGDALYEQVMGEFLTRMQRRTQRS